MAFSKSERVIYEQNTLEEVKCEIAFPSILKVESSSPADFQEVIRDDFPHYLVKNSFRIPPGLPQGLAASIEGGMGTKVHTFTSEDRKLTIALKKSGVSLASSDYLNWEVFREQIRKLLAALNDVYRPSFFLHTCIRYQNSIRRSRLGLDAVPWPELLQPWIAGPISSPHIGDDTEGMQLQCKFRLPDNKGQIEAFFATGTHNQSSEPVFLIGAHVLNNSRKELADVMPCLESLHYEAGCFFRECITDRLHAAMRPRHS